MSNFQATDKIKKLAGYIKENPDDTLSKFALALEFIKQDELKRARILFESIRENEPGYDGVYYHLGKLYQRLGRTDDARSTFRQGIEVAANNGKMRTVSELEEALTQLETESQ